MTFTAQRASHTDTAAEPTRTRITAALARRWPTAVAIVAAAASLAAVSPLPERWQGWIGAWGLLAAAVIYLSWGTARSELTDRRWRTAQTVAVLAFGAVAIAAVVCAPAVGRCVLAAGWLAHAGWDLAHHRAGRVVPRWYAEACLVCDLAMATALLVPAAF